MIGEFLIKLAVVPEGKEKDQEEIKHYTGVDQGVASQHRVGKATWLH